MRLTEKDILARRNVIVSTAVNLFCQKGISNVTLSNIAKKSRVSDNTIYRYFGNKENLVLESFLTMWDNIMSDVRSIVDEVPGYVSLSGYEQMRVWIESFRQLYKSKEDFVLFSYDAKIYLLHQEVVLDKFQQDMLMKSFRVPCIAALNKGKQDGSIPTKVDSEDLFYAIWGGIRGYVIKIVIYGKLFGKDSPWERRYEVLEKGILCALRYGWDVT